VSTPSDAEMRKTLAANRDQAADALRDDLVRLALLVLDRAKLPPGHHAVVVVTDVGGAFVGCAGTGGDEYTHAMLVAALEGAEYRIHANAAAAIITKEGSGA
jgi:hypothetical protein